MRLSIKETAILGLLCVLLGGRSAPAQPAVGDTDRDGIQNSVGDLTMFSCWLSGGFCEDDYGPEYDMDCMGSGFDIYSDLVALYHIMLGIEEPCYAVPDYPPSGQASSASKSSLDSDFAIEIGDLEIHGDDTGWVDIVMTAGSESFSGFQLHLEYDATRLELLDFQFGEPFSDFLHWDWAQYHDTTEGTVSRIKVAANHLGRLESRTDAVGFLEC